MVDDNRQHFNVSREALGLPSDEDKPDKKIEKVVEGEVVRKHKGRAQKVAETFFGGDLREVAMFTLTDVFIPAAKNMLFETLTKGFERLLWNDNQSSAPRSGMQHFNYSKQSTSRSGTGSRAWGRSQRESFDFADISPLPRREDAEKVLARMYDLLDAYHMVTVGEFYGLVGITPEYTDEKWGWRNLRGASIQTVRDGYRINLPKPEVL